MRLNGPSLKMLRLLIGRGTLLLATQGLAWQVNATATNDNDKIEPLNFLLNGVVFVDWMFYGACGVALLVLLWQRADWRRGDRAYFGAGVLFALSALAVTVGAIATKPAPTIAGLAVLVIGVAAFQGFRTAANPPPPGDHTTEKSDPG